MKYQHLRRFYVHYVEIKSAANLELMNNMIVLPDISTESMGKCADWLDCTIRKSLPVTEQLGRILIRTYKFRTASTRFHLWEPLKSFRGTCFVNTALDQRSEQVRTSSCDLCSGSIWFVSLPLSWRQRRPALYPWGRRVLLREANNRSLCKLPVLWGTPRFFGMLT